MFWINLSNYKFSLFSLGFTLITISLGTISYAHPNDPLSKDEINKLSLLTQESQGRTAARASSKKTNEVKQPNEILLIERHYQKYAPKGQRLADVFTYDYQRNELIESLVDLNSSRVISTSRKQGVQLPLTQNELKRVKRIVFEDDVERRILENEYQRITSQKLTDSSELYFKAFTFVANNLPHRANEASKLCGIQRCAQIVLYTGQNIVFEVSPIVNLSEGVVTQRVGF
jgi:Cu2+-containing amine oxidase